MWQDSQDRDRPDDDWDVEPTWSSEMSLGDPEGWRGTIHLADESWRASENAGPEWTPWPEWSAGPEYLMWKRRVDEEQ